ncbi:MAG: DEAD/DEAH box helicase, partial [Chloroflexi bacterium]|nr:DEAD/DEAH box helicase [Chloroflexota bacterium]
MDVSTFIERLVAQPGYDDQIVHVEHIPRRGAIHGELERPLVATLQDSLSRHGLLPLYTHQAEAVNKARQGMNVVVSTASASGKSLCYNTAVMESLLTGRSSRALYL